MDQFKSPSWIFGAKHFARALEMLTNHRGPDVENELIEVIGRLRLGQLYAGEDPTFGEVIECARILDVPITSFLIYDRGDIGELELAFAEILHKASRMTPEERMDLAEAMVALVHKTGVRDQESSGSEESIVSLFRDGKKK